RPASKWSACETICREFPGSPSHHDRRLLEKTVAACLFCQIINHELNATIVYEDEHVVAFNDINPQAPTHVLVVPRRHIASLNDLTDEDDQIVGEVVRRAAAIAKDRGVSASGFR